jgi:hypothetical protein
MRAMRTALALVLLAAAACGGKAATSDTTPDNTGGATAGGAPYATMFEQGHTWKLQVTSRESHWDDQDPAADANGNVVSEGAPRQGSCTVAQVVEVAGGKASKIECEWGTSDGEGGGMAGNDPLSSGAWFASDAGLYMIQELPAAGATVEVGEDELVLAAQPVAFTRSLVDENDEETEGMVQVALEQKDGAWCYTYSAALGDEIWMTLCFGPDDLRGGDFGWAGGSEHTTTFTVVK